MCCSKRFCICSVNKFVVFFSLQKNQFFRVVHASHTPVKALEGLVSQLINVDLLTH